MFVIVYIAVGTTTAAAAGAGATSVRDIDAPDVPFIPFVVVALKLSPSLPSAHPYASEWPSVAVAAAAAARNKIYEVECCREMKYS